jgi:phosphatidylglycerophosphate synthase
VTDWFDGWLARKLGQTSAFGAFLDPVADKLMVAAALVVLVDLGRADAVVAFIIVCYAVFHFPRFSVFVSLSFFHEELNLINATLK